MRVFPRLCENGPINGSSEQSRGEPISVFRMHYTHPFAPIFHLEAVQESIRRAGRPITLAAHVGRPSFVRPSPVPNYGPLPPYTHAKEQTFYAACAKCQRIKRSQQISASFRATATRAIFALDRLRVRV